MIRRFFSYYRKHWKLFALDIVCSLLVAVCNLVYPFITRNIINVYVPSGQVRQLAIWSGALLAIYIMKCLLNFTVQYWGHVLGVRIQGDMRQAFFDHLEKLPFRFFDDNKTGSLMSRLTSDLFDISELAHHGPEDTFNSVITVLGAFVMLSTINIYLTLIVFAILPFMLWYTITSRRKMRTAFKRSREEMAEINASVESSISGIRVSKAYTAEAKETEKFHSTNLRYMDARRSALKYMGYFQSGMTLFNDLLYLIVLFAGGMFYYNYVRGIGNPIFRIDIGDFAAYILYVTMLLNPIRTLTNVFEQIQNGATGFVRFCEIMDVPVEEQPSLPVPVEKLRGDIVYDNVTFCYKNNDSSGMNVVHDFSMKIGVGQTVALVGPSGSGKTTICHLLPRFYEIDQGKITIDGIDIRDMSRYDLRRNIGIVAQDIFLFGGSFRDNIAYGSSNVTDEQIINAAKCANIHDYIVSLPNGYDTNIGERGVKLSGGQKQRLSIARAFIKNPPILILDEATSALDNVTERQIQQALDKLCAGRTTIVVAHRLTTIRNADRIIVIDNGNIREQGTHDELMALDGEYAAFKRATEE